MRATNSVETGSYFSFGLIGGMNMTTGFPVAASVFTLAINPCMPKPDGVRSLISMRLR